MGMLSGLLAHKEGMSFLALEIFVFIVAFHRGLGADTDGETSAVPLWDLLLVVHHSWPWTWSRMLRLLLLLLHATKGL